jgi:HPt (histidine-containing phosphotransfer) domain-containing protein
MDRHPGPSAVHRVINTAPLRRLLRMAGPLGARDIMAAFLDDLTSAEISLDTAWNGPDFAALRAQAHVLIALAGTVGDTDLQAMAQDLNTLAHDQDTDKIRATRAQIMGGLAELISTLATFSWGEE